MEAYFSTILNFVKKVGFEEALSADTRVYSKLIKEFYLSGKVVDGVIKTKEKDITLTYEPKEFELLLGFVNDGDTRFDIVDTKKGLDFMGYDKKKPNVKGLKKKDFPQDFEFLANIVPKCILCKDSAHDSISELQHQIMSAITSKVSINYGVVMFGWISKWFTDVEKRKKDEKSLPKMNYDRFIGILLKKKMRQHIRKKDEEPFNVN